MLATYLALVLAGNGPGSSSEPGALGEISNLTASTLNTGDCSTATAAQIGLFWRGLNFDPDFYRIDVYLDSNVGGNGTVPLSTLFGGPTWFGPMYVSWSQDPGAAADSPKGTLTIHNMVENASGSFTTWDWKFRVKLVRLSDESVVTELSAQWNKTYVAC